MQEWKPFRGCIQEDAFLQDAEAYGIPIQALDEVMRTDIEDVLCGASDEKLDIVYPVLVPPDKRLLLTNRRGEVPGLRVAWRIATEDHGKIHLLRCAPRGLAA